MVRRLLFLKTATNTRVFAKIANGQVKPLKTVISVFAIRTGDEAAYSTPEMDKGRSGQMCPLETRFDGVVGDIVDTPVPRMLAILSKPK